MTMALLLQSLGNSCYLDGESLTCLTDQYVSAFGSEGLLGVLIGVCIFATFYIAGDGNMATPTVALILMGTALVGMLPGNYSQIAMYVVVLGLAAAIWQVIQRYVLTTR